MELLPWHTWGELFVLQLLGLRNSAVLNRYGSKLHILVLHCPSSTFPIHKSQESLVECDWHLKPGWVFHRLPPRCEQDFSSIKNRPPPTDLVLQPNSSFNPVLLMLCICCLVWGFVVMYFFKESSWIYTSKLGLLKKVTHAPPQPCSSSQTLI